MCNTAERELVKVNVAGLALPGDFNMSASTLFGGSHAGLFTRDQAWARDAQNEGVSLNDIGVRTEEARVKFSTGVAVLGTDEQQDLLGATSLDIVKKESNGLEVTAISLPDNVTRELYATQSEVVKSKLGNIKPLGELMCKIWYSDDCDEWDLPKDKYPDGKPRSVDGGREFKFWVEENVLNECFVGMKIDASIITLESGITILDEVKQTHCSFYKWLPNELWMKNKPKNVRWLAKGSSDYEIEINGVTKEGQEKAQEDDEFDDE
jgi:hypothetical protein